MRRKAQIALSIFLLFYQTGRGQSTFNNVYDYKKHLDFGYDILQDDSSYLSLTSAEAYNSGDAGILLSSFTPSGVLLWNKFFSKKGYSYYTGNPGTFFRTRDGGFAFGGTLQINDTSNYSQAILVKFKKDGDTAWVKKYSYSGYDGGFQAVQTPDGGYALFGVTVLGGTHFQYYLVRADSNGNLLWQNIYGGGSELYGLNISAKNNGHFLLSGGMWEAIYYVPLIIEVDDSGNVVTEKKFNNLFYDSGDIIAPTNDGGYIIWGVSDTVITGNYQYPRYFAKLDSNLNTKWQTTFSETTIKDFYNIRQMKDSSYICVGFHADPITGSAFGWIAKTDENGNILWQHDYYKRQDYDNYMADVQQTSDKGYIITGTAWDSMPNPSQDIWLIRLDSNGCLIPGCDTAVTGIIEVTNAKSEFSIFPNPTSDKATVFYNVPAFVQDAKLEIYDMEGKLIYHESLNAHQHELNLITSEWPPGVYICSIFSNSQLPKSKCFAVVR